MNWSPINDKRIKANNNNWLESVRNECVCFGHVEEFSQLGMRMIGECVCVYVRPRRAIRRDK